MMGEQEATVVRTRAFDLHGVTYNDVELKLSDGSSVDGRLGAEAVPEGLQPGERVLAMLAAGLLISIKRP